MGRPKKKTKPCRLCGTVGGKIESGCVTPRRTNGLCYNCYQKSKYKPVKPKRLKPCTNCGKMHRNTSSYKKGTHRIRGFCIPCYRRMQYLKSKDN